MPFTVIELTNGEEPSERQKAHVTLHVQSKETSQGAFLRASRSAATRRTKSHSLTGERAFCEWI